MKYNPFFHFKRLLILVFILGCISAWMTGMLMASSQGELSREEHEQNRIVVRVWHYQGLRDSVGHVSVHLPSYEDKDNNYASFWPAQPFLLWSMVPGEFNSLIGDYISEKRPPDTIVSLYTLNAKMVEKRFLEFKEQVSEDKEGERTGKDRLGTTRQLLFCK